MPAQPLPVVVVLDNVRSMYNAGAFFRTCDAAGVLSGEHMGAP